jgi:hypothetical protein
VLYETYSEVHICKHLSDNILIQDYLKHRDALMLLLFNFALEYAIRNVKETQMGQLLGYADDVNLLGDNNIDTIKTQKI